MDETQIAIDTAVELANLARELNNIQMIFFITIVIIIFSAFLFFLLYRVTATASKSDNIVQRDLLTALSQATTASSEAVRLFSGDRKEFWERNTREHRFIMRNLSRLNSVTDKLVVTLETMNTNEVKSDETQNIVSPFYTINPIDADSPPRSGSRQ